MDSLERIKKVINWLVFSGKAAGQNDLASRLGYSKSYMSSVLNNARALSDSLIGKLCSLDENINYDWVVSGSGRMFKNNPFSEFDGCISPSDGCAISGGSVVVDASVWAVVKAQADSLAARDRQVDELVSMLRSQIEELKKMNAQQGGHAISADAV